MRKMANGKAHNVPEKLPMKRPAVNGVKNGHMANNANHLNSNGYRNSRVNGNHVQKRMENGDAKHYAKPPTQQEPPVKPKKVEKKEPEPIK